MNVIILNSAPGAGKSTSLKLIEEKLGSGYAVIDGDDVGRIMPLKKSIEWLNLIQDNLASCAKNFREHDTNTLIVCFVFPTVERLQRLVNLLEKNDFSTFHIKLTCPSDVLAERIKTRNTQKVVNVQRALELNGKIEKLHANYSINTAQKTPEKVADILCEKIYNIENGSEVIHDQTY
jgi:adenylate kinase family enzyme